MNWMIETGRFLIVAGGIIIVVGFLLVVSDKIPLGKLPGDIRLGGGRVQLYIPIATCVLLSVVITVLVNVFSRK